MLETVVKCNRPLNSTPLLLDFAKEGFGNVRPQELPNKSLQLRTIASISQKVQVGAQNPAALFSEQYNMFLLLAKVMINYIYL